MLSSQGIDSGLVSFEMVFESLQFELPRFNFHSLSYKILKIPEIYGVYEMRFLKLKNSKFMSADFRLRNLNKSLTNIYYHVRY